VRARDEARDHRMHKCTGTETLRRSHSYYGKSHYRSTEAGLEIVDFISHQFVILPCWYMPRLSTAAGPMLPANSRLACCLTHIRFLLAHFQSFLMSNDHLNCKWVCWSSSTNLETAS
jgi:hypothetical protein